MYVPASRMSASTVLLQSKISIERVEFLIILNFFLGGEPITQIDLLENNFETVVLIDLK